MRDSPAALHNLGVLHFFAGNHDRGIELMYRSLELIPEHPHLLSTLANMYAETGRPDEALDLAGQVLDRVPGLLSALFAKSLALARAGRRAEVEALIAEIEALPNANAYTLARAWASLDERARVFELLDFAVTRREPAVSEIGMTPALAAYRDDPRMAGLRQRIGLP